MILRRIRRLVKHEKHLRVEVAISETDIFLEIVHIVKEMCEDKDIDKKIRDKYKAKIRRLVENYEDELGFKIPIDKKEEI